MPEAAPPGSPQGRLLLGLDFGERRIGVAAGDTLTRSARPLGVVRARAGRPDWPALARHVRALMPGLVVVGVPYNMDGSPGHLTARAQAFGRAVHARFGLEVVTVDERLSSHEGAARLKDARERGERARRVRREDVDAAAACVLLEQWLHAR